MVFGSDFSFITLVDYCRRFVSPLLFFLVILKNLIESLNMKFLEIVKDCFSFLFLGPQKPTGGDFTVGESVEHVAYWIFQALRFVIWAAVVAGIIFGLFIR